MASGRLDGRRLGFDRLLFFSDAVFAIAITLLVLDLRVPDDAHAPFDLTPLIPRFAAFGVSFYVIGRYWMAHHSLFEGVAGLPGSHPPRLDAEKRRDGLQIVLDPVVNLSDRGVLGHEQPVPPAQVAHVPEQHQRPGDHPLIEQRDAADDHRGLRFAHLLDRREVGLEGQGHRSLLKAGLVEAETVDPRVETESVKSIHRVR